MIHGLTDLKKTSLDALTEKYEKDNPNADKGEIDKMLDKKYNDAAKIILEKWNSFTGIAANYEDMNDAVEENVEEITDKMNENIEQDITSMTSDEQDELIEDTGELQKETFDQTEDFIGIAVSMELEERETDDENMREFFAQPAKNFKGNDIRKLYPMVESLSKGQIAGLDFFDNAGTD
jgi:hypothetical protein